MGTPLKAVLILMLSVKTVTCYSRGDVEEACDDMTPHHDRGHSSPDPPPYSITVDKTILSPGVQIKVTLSANPKENNVYFKGFFIQARNAEDLTGGAIGSFTLLNPDISQKLRCHKQEASAVSHTSGAHKTEVQVIWNAPTNPPSNVQFIATVVQNYKIFWVKIPGPVLSQNGTSPPPPPPTSFTVAAQTTTPSVQLLLPFTSDLCGLKKSCFRDPAGCDPQNDPLCYFMSFRKEGQSVTFELSGTATGYVSFALSADKWMGNDDVYLCINDTDGVEIGAAYVEGRTHPIMASKNVLKDTAWRLSEGVIQCRFSRNIYIPAPNENRSDLDQMYYLFMAHGRVDNGRTHRHDRQPVISTKKVAIIGPPEDLSGSRAPLLIKFHAAFMMVGWLMTVSTGVIIARYFKLDWAEKTLCGQRVWFQVHRCLMLLTVLLTAIGFVLAFIYRGGWSKRAGSHPYLGCTVMALAIIQPIMALFRPSPDSARRYIFNWLHFGTGTIAQVLAVVATFLGIHQQALLLPAPWTTGLLAACVIWFVTADLVLEVHKRGFFCVGRFFKNLQFYSESVQADDKEEILVVRAGNDTSIKGFGFRKLVLLIYLCGNFVFLVLLMGTISGV